MDDSSKILLTNSLMLDAIVELLTEKGVLSREEIFEKVKAVRNAERGLSHGSFTRRQEPGNSFSEWGGQPCPYL